MATRDSAGTYAATANSFNPAVTGTTIDAAAWNSILGEIKVEITDSLSRSGKGGMLADLDMSSHYINNLASASVGHQAVNLTILQNLSATLHTEIGTLSATYATDVRALSATLETRANDLSASWAARDYVVLSAASVLQNERVLTMGVGLSSNDAGAGNAFTVSLKDGPVRDLASATIVHGNVFYVDSNHALVPLAPGTSGQFLKTQGASANPIWATLAGGGDMLAANNLSDVVNANTAFNNIKQAATYASSGAVFFASAADYWAATANKALETSATWAAAVPVTLVDATTVTCNFAAGINFIVTLGGSRTLKAKNAKPGQSGSIYINQSGGARTLGYDSNFKFAGGTAPTLSTSLSTASGALDVLTYHVLSATFITGTMLKNVK